MSEFVPRTIECSGKSIDEAIFNGLQSLGVSIDEVNITTVQQAQKGVFGIGSKPCIVRLVERPPDFAEIMKAPTRRDNEYTERRTEKQAEKPQPTAQHAENREKSEQRREPDPRRENVQARYDKPKENRAEPQSAQAPKRKSESRGNESRSGGRGGDGRRNDARRGDRRTDERPVPVDTTVYTHFVPGESNCEGARFVSGVLKRMGLDAGLGFAEEGDTLKLKIDSDAMGILIGHRGETLDAMQYLTGLVVNRGEEGYKRVTLDTENYRNKREETLGRLARKLAGQVRATGKPVTLEPMNPYERRVLHFALQNNPYVTTHSEGEEPNRYVVIVPKPQASTTSPQ